MGSDMLYPINFKRYNGAMRDATARQ